MLHSPALSILASQICLNVKYMRMLDKILSDMMSGVNIPLTLCLWVLRAYRMLQFGACLGERIGCGCLRRSYTCRICDVQRFKLSYPITFAIIQPLDVWGGSTSSRKTCIRLRDTSDTSDTRSNSWCYFAKPAFHFSDCGAPSLPVLDGVQPAAKIERNMMLSATT